MEKAWNSILPNLDMYTVYFYVIMNDERHDVHNVIWNLHTAQLSL